MPLAGSNLKKFKGKLILWDHRRRPEWARCGSGEDKEKGSGSNF
jgi:hypothetical protein